jgi:NAD(P)H-hydrate epimerase
MSDISDQLYTAEQVRDLDACAIRDAQIPGFELMRRAGRRIFSETIERWPETTSLAVISGPGNNGGDGYVVARLALEAGLSVQLLQLGDPGRVSGDAALARTAFLDADGMEVPAGGPMPEADVIVDALLGTGLERPLRGRFLDTVRWINGQTCPVVSVDIPSGLNADSGAVMGTAVQADLTITFVGRKQGMYTANAVDLCGELIFDDLGIPGDIYAKQASSARMMTSDNTRSMVSRDRSAHKGQFGHVLVLGGGPGMPGAVIMAGLAALRTGAGRVTIATHPDHAAQIPLAHPELMCQAVAGPADLHALFEAADCVVFGPGLGTDSWATMLFNEMLTLQCPVVIDADGLNLLSRSGHGLGQWILTPHPAEAARLLGATTSEIQADRYASVTAISDRYQSVTVLKGAGSLVHEPGMTWLCPRGNPGMATAGMGDILSGVIGGLLAQGLGQEEAARLGVFVHASAGDQAAEHGERGMMATDLLEYIRAEVNRL